MIPFLVLGFWDKNTGVCAAPCHIAGIPGRFQDSGISSLILRICTVILSVGRTWVKQPQPRPERIEVPDQAKAPGGRKKQRVQVQHRNGHLLDPVSQ